ncbi:hypothetical protein F4808DRAFT_468543, partial [Astrocystis sublimbata]
LRSTYTPTIQKNVSSNNSRPVPEFILALLFKNHLKAVATLFPNMCIIPFPNMRTEQFQDLYLVNGKPRDEGACEKETVQYWLVLQDLRKETGTWYQIIEVEGHFGLVKSFDKRFDSDEIESFIFMCGFRTDQEQNLNKACMQTFPAASKVWVYHVLIRFDTLALSGLRNLGDLISPGGFLSLHDSFHDSFHDCCDSETCRRMNRMRL